MKKPPWPEPRQHFVDGLLGWFEKPKEVAASQPTSAPAPGPTSAPAPAPVPEPETEPTVPNVALRQDYPSPSFSEGSALEPFPAESTSLQQDISNALSDRKISDSTNDTASTPKRSVSFHRPLSINGKPSDKKLKHPRPSKFPADGVDRPSNLASQSQQTKSVQSQEKRQAGSERANYYPQPSKEGPFQPQSPQSPQSPALDRHFTETRSDTQSTATLPSRPTMTKQTMIPMPHAQPDPYNGMAPDQASSPPQWIHTQHSFSNPAPYDTRSNFQLSIASPIFQSPPQPSHAQTATAAAPPVPTKLPDLETLARPEELFRMLAPYHIIMDVADDEISIHGSHQPSLELLAGYFKKNIRNLVTHRGRVWFPFSPLLRCPLFPYTDKILSPNSKRRTVH